ncbi:MAG TPA: NUDIX hydrolase [Pseudonocardiaceae bacterium]|nr:NUDIX hydrolase [Pseudonocardiaceae bacterium]
MTGDDRRHRFEVLSSRTAYAGRVMALRVDEVSMPGGGSAVREVVEHPGAVAVAAVDDEHRVVMVHQYRHPVGRRLWELPAGLLDVHGEDPQLTAKRELAEEVGLAAIEWSVLVDLAASPGFTDEGVRVYLATELTAVDRPGPMGDEEDDLQVRRFPLVEAVRMVLAGEIVNATAIAGLLAAHAVLGGTGSPRPANAPWPGRPTSWAARKSGR